MGLPLNAAERGQLKVITAFNESLPRLRSDKTSYPLLTTRVKQDLDAAAQSGHKNVLNWLKIFRIVWSIAGNQLTRLCSVS